MPKRQPKQGESAMAAELPFLEIHCCPFDAIVSVMYDDEQKPRWRILVQTEDDGGLTVGIKDRNDVERMVRLDRVIDFVIKQERTN